MANFRLECWPAWNRNTRPASSESALRHRHQEFIAFLDQIEDAVPAGKVIHAIMDNYATHKHPEVLAWLADNPRWTFHFTPASCSWLNAVEGFFSKLTRQALRRGVFRSVEDLVPTIDRYVAHANDDPEPFVWTASAASIMAKLKMHHPSESKTLGRTFKVVEATRFHLRWLRCDATI